MTPITAADSPAEVDPSTFTETAQTNFDAPHAAIQLRRSAFARLRKDVLAEHAAHQLVSQDTGCLGDIDEVQYVHLPLASFNPSHEVVRTAELLGEVALTETSGVSCLDDAVCRYACASKYEGFIRSSWRTRCWSWMT